MNRPFPMTRLAGGATFQVLRWYFALPWWGMALVGIIGFVAMAKI